MATRTPTLQPTTLAEEAERLRRAYRRDPGPATQLDLYGLCTLEERQERMMMFFREKGFYSLRSLKVLDVGCGVGGMLRRLSDFGVDPRDCVGIDLRSDALRRAREFNPNITFLEGNAAQLPFADRQFDLVFQSTVFTSVLDTDVRKAAASEILRTLKLGGYLVWYDFAYSNPRNPNVRGVGRREIRELLPGARLSFYRVTVAPPIGRIAARVSPLLYRLLSLLPPLRTHYLCFAEKGAR